MKKPHQEAVFVSAEGLAPILGVSSRTVRRLRNAELVPYYKVGGRTLYKIAEALEAMERLRVSAKGE